RRAAAIATGSNPTEYPSYANRGVVIVSVKRNPNVIPFFYFKYLLCSNEIPTPEIYRCGMSKIFRNKVINPSLMLPFS
ncbi:hypothetical protein, partial [Bacillus velezensis]|uniref:hypothetical protein n=1 Tax=Bacillus velezensis TaxID=492670 RepID=UPI0033997D85